MGTEGGPSIYRQDRSSTPTFDSHIQTEASRIERELRERTDRWRISEEEIRDADVTDEAGDERAASSWLYIATKEANKLRAHEQLMNQQNVANSRGHVARRGRKSGNRTPPHGKK